MFRTGTESETRESGDRGGRRPGGKALCLSLMSVCPFCRCSYGTYSTLYPHRRGQPVQNTYCHRLFKDCSPGRCFVQSPAYPGIYPRNLACKYRINVRQSLVGLDLTFFDVDGLRCDNLLMCFPRPISRKADDCPFDFVRIHDGPTEDHPVITTLCGRGRLKSNIVASNSEMLVTFVSSPAGPLLNTGFHFKVG